MSAEVLDEPGSLLIDIGIRAVSGAVLLVVAPERLDRVELRAGGRQPGEADTKAAVSAVARNTCMRAMPPGFPARG